MESDLDGAVQKQLDAAMPWVGLYIAAASAVCTLAIAIDALNGFRRRKLWFPCKYTSLNAASLTVLAAAMKLSMDLNTVMINSETDAYAKFSSLIFMSTALNSAMPSLGSMKDNELLANVVGLAILVVTITANVAIQIIELQRFLKQATVIVLITIPLILMLVSLAMLLSLALSVSMMKRSLKGKYQEKHKAALEEEEEMLLRGDDALKMDDQRRRMMKYWVMAESSSPQFVVARSNVCTTSSFIIFFSSIIITLVHILQRSSTQTTVKSLYGIYTKWIVNIQSIGPGLAVIVATLRWFVVVASSDSCGKLQFKVESYWVHTLKNCRNSLGFKIGPNKHLLDVKWCVLTFCIGLQCFVVLVSKTLMFFSRFIVTPFVSCFSHIINKFARHHDTSAGGEEVDPSLSGYVLLLDGEVELPQSFVRSMCRKADRMIQIGRDKKPSNLINLLHRSVKKSNTCQITSLLSHDCWTLQVVTLTSIALALPNISQHQRKQLLRSVSEGLSLAKIVEKTLDTNAGLKSARKAASVTWVEVLVYSKWVGIDLRRAFLRCKNCEEVLQELSNKAKGILVQMKTELQDYEMRSVAANSMNTTCQTILLSSWKEESGEEMWERLCVMIANILANCLTNLAQAITKMCHQSCIEKREKSVHEAFLLLGKTEVVVGIARQQQKDDEASTSTDETHLAMTVDC